MSADPIEEQSRQLLAEARNMKAQVSDVMQRYEDAVWNAAWDKGYGEGWRAGYEHAFEQFQQAARFHAQSQTPPAPSNREASGIAPEMPKLKAADVVLAIVTNSPGLRGVEIANMAGRWEEPLKERTVRTALHRLKLADRIYVDDERWFAKSE